MRAIIWAWGLLVSLNGFAQPKEYIIKHDGDTVTGEVKVLAKQIKIIRAPADTIVLNSEDVRFFVKNNSIKTVLRLILYGYTDNIEAVQTYNYSDPVYDTTILLTRIISGEKLNLFTGKDKRKVVYFFVQSHTDSVPVQLLYAVGGDIREREKWNRPYQSYNFITRHRIFENQLWDMTSDCEYITVGDLRILEYRESSFRAFVKRYNKKCK